MNLKESPQDVAARLRDALGGEHARLRTSTEDLASYGRDFSYVVDKGPPQFVALPKTKEEVSSLLVLAGELGIPVTARSAGLGLGTTMSTESGLVIDCTLMNRVLSIDTETETVVVESGVSFEELAPILAQKGYAVSVPDAPPTASVLANHLNFGAGGYLTRHGLGADLVVGLEVVLPDGSIAKTGTGSADGVNAFGRYASNPIPDLTGLFLGSLGTLGIVTSVAIKMFQLPKAVAHRKFGFASMELASRAAKLAAARQLADQVTAYSWFFLAEATAKLADRVDGQPLSDSTIQEMRREVAHLPEAYVFFTVHSDLHDFEGRMTALTKLVTTECMGRPLNMSADETAKCDQIAFGQPHEFSKRALLGKKGRYQGAFGNYSVFAPLSSWEPLYRAWGEIGARFGHPVTIYAKLMPQGRFSIFGFFLSYYNQDDKEDRKRMADLCTALDKETRRLGGVPAVALPGQLPESAGYPLYTMVKRALDPKDIMRPSLCKRA
jgi:hypothetical protein